MPENAIDSMVSEIRGSASEWYPGKGAVQAVRVVNRTPRNGYYLYELVIDFEQQAERIALKVYRAGRSAGGEARRLATAENQHLRRFWQTAQAHGIEGVPRPLGDFGARGAVANEKLAGVPLQSMILKAALLPGYNGMGQLQSAAAASGAWLRAVQRATAQAPSQMDSGNLQREVETLCERCRKEGLDAASIGKIVSATRVTLEHAHAPQSNAAVLHEFTPMHVVVMERGVGFSHFAEMEERGSTYTDPATFLASVEVLEKYPFCDHAVTGGVQQQFLEAYGAGQEERAMLDLFKMKSLLAMFAAGRVGRESPARKKVMWANVMKKFIQTVADRALPRAA